MLRAKQIIPSLTAAVSLSGCPQELVQASKENIIDTYCEKSVSCEVENDPSCHSRLDHWADVDDDCSPHYFNLLSCYAELDCEEFGGGAMENLVPASGCADELDAVTDHCAFSGP